VKIGDLIIEEFEERSQSDRISFIIEGRRLSLYEKEIKLIQSNRSIIRQVVSFSLQYKMNAHRPRVQFSVESSPNLRQPHLLIQNSNIFLHESRFKAL